MIDYEDITQDNYKDKIKSIKENKNLSDSFKEKQIRLIDEFILPDIKEGKIF